ncbi:MAG TPA: polyphosphate polymerase domain-containing protein [Vicinamibacterales bacterium]|jgi:hypothetical protein
MSHSREIRPQALEIKFVVPSAQADAIRRWARTHLEHDPHGAGPFRDEYRTSSIYFDNTDGDVFHRRGSFGRSKYRIRRYANESVVFLERKMRQPAVLAKRRTCMPLSTLDRLARPEDDAPWAGEWFHRRIVARRLEPVCQMSYARTARMILRNGEPVRLTLDSDLAVHPVDGFAFTNGEGMPVLPGSVILELKYRGTFPAIFRHLVEEFAIAPRAASKYRIGVAALTGIHPEPAAARGGAEALYA